MYPGTVSVGMDNVEYAYTSGMDDDAVEQRLRAGGTGVLALANDGEAYAVPLAHYYDDGHLYFRLSTTEDSTKWAWIEATERATYVVYGTEAAADADEIESWSIHVTGPIRRLSAEERERFDAAEINRQFTPIRVFDEAIEDVDIEIVELAIESMTGRRTDDAGRSGS